MVLTDQAEDQHPRDPSSSCVASFGWPNCRRNQLSPEASSKKGFKGQTSLGSWTSLGRRKTDFSEDIKAKALLWSDRHCCLCGNPCGTDIEVAHIEKGRNDLDNAIPLCYDCHAETGRYSKEHPRGNRYRPQELRTRRDQVYERYTRHLVPPIDFKVTQLIGRGATESSHLPRVGFIVRHLGDSFPVRLKVKMKVFLGDKDLGLIESPKKPYYSGGITWNLNPRHTFFGNLSVPSECVDSTEDLKLEVQVAIIDMYGRKHDLLPVCYAYAREGNYWFLEPTSFDELRRFAS